jgi:hypothetical protein
MRSKMNYIFFHIPRTGGASLWISIANSIDHEKMHVLDTAHESISRYQCPRHEEELLEFFLKETKGSPSIIHVHSRFNIPLIPNTVLISAEREYTAWKKSLIWAHINSIFLHRDKVVDTCTHPNPRLRKTHRKKSIIKWRNKITFFIQVLLEERTFWDESASSYKKNEKNLLQYHLNEQDPAELESDFYEIIKNLPVKLDSVFVNHEPRTHNSHGRSKQIASAMFYLSEPFHFFASRNKRRSFMFHATMSVPSDTQ